MLIGILSGTLSLVAVAEVLAFFYLRHMISKVGHMKVETHSRLSQADTIFEEAFSEYEEAQEAHTKAKFLRL